MKNSCCETASAGTHEHHKKRFDWLLWGSLVLVALGYGMHLFAVGEIANISWLMEFSMATFELMNKMWWGLLLGIIFVGILEVIPQQFVISLLGKGGTFRGILRATGAGVLLDLCSHGILLVGMKLYRQGASLGQTMAFLIASPWNSISLTLIFWALVGFKWMISFLLLSLLIAVISGWFFEKLVQWKILPENPNTREIPEDFAFWPEAKKHFGKIEWRPKFFMRILRDGFFESRMILKWIFFGVVLAALSRVLLTPENFQTFFGPTLAGLGLTVLIATILEVCSEGSTPIAAEILTRAHAPGNSFAFLMTGVATDYTEILAIRETTKSWKISLFLPLVTVPQVLLIAWILNRFAETSF